MAIPNAKLVDELNSATHAILKLAFNLEAVIDGADDAATARIIESLSGELWDVFYKITDENAARIAMIDFKKLVT